jgi:hypothetical protein
MNHTFTLRLFALTFIAVVLAGGIYVWPLTGLTTQAQSKPAGKGSFKVGRSPKSEKKNVKLKMTNEDRQALQEIATEMNKVFILPQDIYLSVDECGEANAFYDPESKEIIMCTELVTQFEESFGHVIKDEEKAASAVEDATMFVFFHELGHALIDIYDLPVTGREEDAVDQLSTLIVADGSAEGAASVFNGALSFVLAFEGELDDSAFAGEHSLGKQRFYSIVCLLYGQDPEAHKEMVNQQVLPESRAQRCPSEYAQIEKAWGRLLSPHMKN